MLASRAAPTDTGGRIKQEPALCVTRAGVSDGEKVAYDRALARGAWGQEGSHSGLRAALEEWLHTPGTSGHALLCARGPEWSGRLETGAPPQPGREPTLCHVLGAQPQEACVPRDAEGCGGIVVIKDEQVRCYPGPAASENSKTREPLPVAKHSGLLMRSKQTISNARAGETGRGCGTYLACMHLTRVDPPNTTWGPQDCRE